MYCGKGKKCKPQAISPGRTRRSSPSPSPRTKALQNYPPPAGATIHYPADYMHTGKSARVSEKEKKRLDVFNPNPYGGPTQTFYVQRLGGKRTRHRRNKHRKISKKMRWW